MRSCFVGTLVLLLCSSTFASTIHVPQDEPTIQAGIIAAQNGDTVLVSPGTYVENINFNGKAITVTSSGGPTITIIDGNAVAPVVVFATNEGTNSVLGGFTLRNGNGTFDFGYNGGGININQASPTIRGNLLEKNVAGNYGGGIAVDGGSPVIKGNVIRNNSAPFGGGLSVYGSGAAQIVGNSIYSNSGQSAGGGMILNSAGTPTIENNFIYLNSAGSGQGQGGGMWIVNDSNSMVVQNLIVGNTASQGGGIYFLVPDSSPGPVLVNNTIAGASGVTQGSAVWAGGFDSRTEFFNNIMVGLSGQNAVWCDATYSQQPPSFMNNDAWSAKGTGLQGTCESQSQQNGNISANPLFVNPHNRSFQLQSKSPAINVGDNNAPDLPSTDLARHPRIVGGTVDIGAFEYQGTGSDAKTINF